MKQALDFISFVPWQFVVSMTNVYILYRIAKHFLFKPVESLFRKRELEVETLYKTAEDRENEALSEGEHSRLMKKTFQELEELSV